MPETKWLNMAHWAYDKWLFLRCVAGMYSYKTDFFPKEDDFSSVLKEVILKV
jgi:hypothetical protein